MTQRIIALALPTAIALASAITFLCGSAQATALDFDGIARDAAIGDYYAGGTSSAGDVGPDFGVNFDSGWVIFGTAGASSGQNTARLYNTFGVVNFAGGFHNLRFQHGGFADAFLGIYDGANGAGELLAIFAVPAGYNFVDAYTVDFSGNARSFSITVGPPGDFILDDIDFNFDDGAAAVPEPATWAMMILGFGAVGALIRRRKTGLAFAA